MAPEIAKNDAILGLPEGEPSSWLVSLLKGKIRGQINHLYRSHTTCLADRLDSHGPATDELRVKIGDAALAALDGCVQIPEADKDADLMHELLYLLGTLPVSHPEKATESLERIRTDERLREKPSADQDIHRTSVIALSHQLKNDDESAGWEERLEDDLNNRSYAIAAMSALSKIRPARAIERLPQVLGLFGDEKAGAASVLSTILFLHCNDDPALLQTLEAALRATGVVSERDIARCSRRRE